MTPTLLNTYSHRPRFKPVQVEDLYYHQFTQGVLWPLFHCIPTNFNEALLENFQGQYEVRNLARSKPSSGLCAVCARGSGLRPWATRGYLVLYGLGRTP